MCILTPHAHQIPKSMQTRIRAKKTFFLRSQFSYEKERLAKQQALRAIYAVSDL